MRRLAPVQFFSWLGLFAMWILHDCRPWAARCISGRAIRRFGRIQFRVANWVGVLFRNLQNGNARALRRLFFITAGW